MHDMVETESKEKEEESEVGEAVEVVEDQSMSISSAIAHRSCCLGEMQLVREPVHSRNGRYSLVLRYSELTIPLPLESLACSS